MKLTSIVLVLVIALLSAGSGFANHNNDERGGRNFNRQNFHEQDFNFNRNFNPGQNFKNVKPRALAEKPKFEELSLSGKLDFVNGHIAVVDNGKTYYVDQVRKLVGFVDGIKEGAAIKVDGQYRVKSENQSTAHPDEIFVRVNKITYNNKEYELAPARALPKQ